MKRSQFHRALGGVLAALTLGLIPMQRAEACSRILPESGESAILRTSSLRLDRS